MIRSKGKKKGIKRKRPVHGVMKAMGKGAGGYLAPGWGAGAGEYIGDRAADLFEKITGYGDYTIHKNSLVGSNSPGIFAGPRSVVVRHREYLGDENGSTSFSTDSYLLNPGNSKTFPWLSQIAGNFEQYRFKGLVIEFKSQSADALNSTNTALGSVLMATQYNSQSAAFTEKGQVANHEFATSSAPSKSALHPVECDMKQSPIDILYVSLSSGSTPNEHSLLYDLGRFYFSTDGMQAVSTIGEIWVSYEVEFLKPRLTPEAGLAMSRSSYSFSNGVTWSQATAFTGPVSNYDDIGVTYTASSVILPAQVDKAYLVTYRLASAVAAAATISGNFVVTNGTGGRNIYGPQNTAVSRMMEQTQLVLSDSDNATGLVLTMPIGDVCGTGAWTGDLLITEVPSNYSMG